MERFILLMLVAATVLAFACSAGATVVDFDTLTWNTDLTGTGYAGITWGTSSDQSNQGILGFWGTPPDQGYATPPNGTPHSLPMCAMNVYGPDNLWFEFSTPVNFEGAWLGQAGANTPPDVRFRDDLGNCSDWMTLESTPKWLGTGFAGSTRIYVERSLVGQSGPAWYLMDDVTYNQAPVPEANSVLLALTGGLPLLGAVARRRRG